MKLDYVLVVLAILFAFMLGGYTGSSAVEKRIATECANSQVSMAGTAQIVCMVIGSPK
jgi:hypothetical protein